MQRVIGLTGGIGSGKSTIAQELAKRGFAVYDCDREAKRIIAECPEVQAAIIDLLGEEAFIKGQSDKVQGTKYNTEYVAKRVFAEPELLEKLNQIIHPAVKEDICQRSGLSAKRSVSETVCQAKPVLFVESAILFEAGLDRVCDRIIVVEAPEDVRIARTIARDYHGEATPENIDKVRARIRAQKTPATSTSQGKLFTVVNDGKSILSGIVDRVCDIASFESLDDTESKVGA